MIKKKLLICIITGIMTFCSCGLFFTDKPEDPQGDKIVDPFSFKDILKINIEEFDFEDYDVLFQEGFIYEDPYLYQYSKMRLLSRLGNIESEYVSGSGEDTIIVKWSLADTTSTEPTFDKEKENTLHPRRYYILIGQLPPPIDTLHIGEATFKVTYDKLMERWVISHWKDIPTDGSEKSFFNPDF